MNLLNSSIGLVAEADQSTLTRGAPCLFDPHDENSSMGIRRLQTVDSHPTGVKAAVMLRRFQNGKRQRDSFESCLKERQMSWAMASGVRATLTRTAVAAAIGGIAVMGAAVPASAMPAVQDDPACGWLGWRHPLCAGGAFDSPVDDGIPGDNAAEGGIPAPSMVPNINGTLSLPGTPGAI